MQAMCSLVFAKQYGKTVWQDDYAAKFNIEVMHDDLAQGEACKIKLVLDTNLLEAGVYVWDLFLCGGR